MEKKHFQKVDLVAILDFQVANRSDLFSIPMRITVPNLVLVSQFARFCLKMDISCSTITMLTSLFYQGHITARLAEVIRNEKFASHFYT